MPSKRRPVGDSLIGATINFVGATPRKREEGRAGVFRYGENFGDFLLTPRAGRASPALQERETPRAQPGMAVPQTQGRPPRKAAASKVQPRTRSRRSLSTRDFSRA